MNPGVGITQISRLSPIPETRIHGEQLGEGPCSSLQWLADSLLLTRYQDVIRPKCKQCAYLLAWPINQPKQTVGDPNTLSTSTGLTGGNW